jgi:CrcB protein
MTYLLFVAIGGASGAVSRPLLASWLRGVWEGKAPVGTQL